MNVDVAAAEIRPRRPWEAIDLGHAMAARWRWPVMRAWLVAFGVPVAGILLACWGAPKVAILLIWWLKPVFDRVALFVYSRLLFGGDARLVTVLEALPGIVFNRELIPSLTLRRFSTARTTVLPVRQLEGGRGKALAQRIQVLMRSRSGRASANLGLACVGMELCLTLGFLGLIEFGWPGTLFPWEEWSLGRELSDEATLPFLRAAALAYVAAVTVVEPFYVAGGFGLYINHRSYLEGWDVQFMFSGLARRARALGQRASGALGALVIGVTLLFAAPPAQAQDDGPGAGPTGAPTGSPTVERARAAAEDVAARDEFSTTELRRVPVSRGSWGKSRSRKTSSGGALAGVVQGLVWTLAIALVVAAIYLILRRVSDHQRDAQRVTTRPTSVFGLDVTAESLPRDLTARARALWQARDRRGALSLLYRGAIAHLIDLDDLVIEESDTERDCLRGIEGCITDSRHAYFARLTDAWQRCAYGEIDPTDPVGEALISAWDDHFITSRDRKGAGPGQEERVTGEEVPA